jgi:hypothetical protein
VKIDADFPGGNIVVEAMDGDTVVVRQELRDTTEWWFWWAFRVTGGAGRRLTFRFTDGDVFSAIGPCASWGGDEWQWLGRDADKMTGFTAEIPEGVDSAYFAFAPLYTRRHLDTFTAEMESVRVPLHLATLCVGEAGADVPLLRVGASGQANLRQVVLTARMHACETMASFVLEGMVREWAVGDSEEARWLRDNCVLNAVPLMDADGVERGDQGKMRGPHDHNRDFSDAPLYASVRALQEMLRNDRGQIDLYLDLHCPWVRYGLNETIFFVGVQEPFQREQLRFAGLLESIHSGNVPYRATDIIPFGEDWNTGPATSSAAWVQTEIQPRLASVLEVAYAQARGGTVTPYGLREFGQSLARAIGAYLREPPRSQ